MNWIEPKTDWKIQLDMDGEYQGDYFEIADYQRICNNLNYLYEKAKQFWSHTETVQLPTAKETDFCTAEMINSIEQAIQSFAACGFSGVIPSMKKWKVNEIAPMVQDLNRMEQTIQTLYLLFVQQQKALPKLAMKVGGGRF